MKRTKFQQKMDAEIRQRSRQTLETKAARQESDVPTASKPKRVTQGPKAPTPAVPDLDELEVVGSCINQPPPDFRLEARQKFLDVAAKERPAVLTALRHKVLPLYKEVFDPANNESLCMFLRGWLPDPAPYDPQAALLWYNRCRFEWASFLEGCANPALPAKLADAAGRLKAALIEWSEKFRLKDDWILDRALMTLNDWVFESGRGTDRWGYQPYIFKVPVDEGRPFSFKFPPWHQDAETWQSYKNRLDAAYEIAKKSYRAYGSEDLGPAARATREERHYRWLVQSRIPQDGQPISIRLIAGRYRVAPQTVREAIFSIAALIDLAIDHPPEN